MKLISSTKTDLKNLKFSILVLTLGMLVASAYATYCVLTKSEMLQSNPKLWIVVVGVYIFTALSGLYYLVLKSSYHKRHHSDW